MNNLGQNDQPKSWFKQFWPWFLIVLPLTAVVASIYTVKIAFDNKDSLVKSDYYKEGLAINEELQEKQNAANLGLTATAAFQPGKQLVVVNLNTAINSPLPKTLKLSMVHTVAAANDFSIPLVETAPGQYQGSYDKQLEHRWYLQLTPLTVEGGKLWKLQTEINFNHRPIAEFTSTQ